ELGFLRPGDRITPNRDRVLGDAKAFALELADGYAPPEPVELRLPGPSGAAALALAVANQALLGRALPHDRVVLAALDLLHTEPTLLRAEQMLLTGKPLRN